jgi:hypothetical protein
MFQFLLASSQQLVLGGTSTKAFPLPPLEVAGSTNENTHSKAFVSSPQHLFVRFEWFMINPNLGWEIPLCEWFEYLSFVKQSSWYLLLLKVKPPIRLGIALELPRLWWAVEKFVKVHFASERKEASASEVRKVVERDPAWSWLLVGNSIYLNGDVEITYGDSKLRQTNSHANPLVCLFLFLLSELLK